jgi:hypothetical protein
MEAKIQLLHPAGKKAFKIDAGKYKVMSHAIIHCLKKQALTHKEMLDAINAYFKKGKIKFEGSVEWYMEGVKLDLEAKKIVKRIKEGSRLKFQLNSQ